MLRIYNSFKKIIIMNTSINCGISESEIIKVLNALSDEDLMELTGIDIDDIKAASYDEGYDEGAEQDSGSYDDGYDEGYKKGRSEGYDEGLKDGKQNSNC
jgi:flagellar biosynthesis/type III secretory pathway protein FliH